MTADRADFLDRETVAAPDHDPVALADLLDLPEPTPPRPSDFPVARQRHWQRIAEREARHTDRARIRTLEARLGR